MTKETKLYRITSIAADGAALDEAARLLREGRLVALPTETVYGLGADAANPDAVASIFAAKGRPQDNPLIVHICSMEMLPLVAREVPPQAKALAAQFWPGPLTMILPKTDYIPSITSAGLDTVAVRYPSHPIALELIRRAGRPIAAPSANLSGSPSTTTAQHCVNDLTGRVDAIVDGGSCTVGLESTVISLTGPVPRLLRPGAVTPEALRAVLGLLEIDCAVTGQLEPGEKAASPGMKYKHYAPSCQLLLLEGSGDAFQTYVNRQAQAEPAVFALCYEEDTGALQCPCIALGARADEAAQAAHLFDCLRELDRRGAKTVYAHCPDRKGVGLALYNRLIRAAAFQVIRLP